MNDQYPSDIDKVGTEALGGWRKITPAVAALRDLTQDDMAKDLTDAQSLLTQIAELEAQLTDLRNKRDAVYIRVWDKVKRVRSAIKGLYGDDSSEYEMVGGTRASDRKPRTKKNATNG